MPEWGWLIAGAIVVVAFGLLILLGRGERAARRRPATRPPDAAPPAVAPPPAAPGVPPDAAQGLGWAKASDLLTEWTDSTPS
ncbi:MAG: hypothetical protein LBI33_08040 [Propionibacteriaceae bacterium]|jgi:hypothetical protein|nr:hypothetical protein [Propionibacteriaceae bacterium]